MYTYLGKYKFGKVDYKNVCDRSCLTKKIINKEQ